MIDVRHKDGLTVLTINRPDKANALTRDMLSSLADAVESAADSIETRALIITGTGKVFSAGADLDAAKAGLATDPIWERLSGAVAACPVLTIAALNGTAAGGALGMVLAADLRVASPETKFFYPVMTLGFLPQPSDPVRLEALVGPARAKLILTTGASVMADQALAIGLVDMVDEVPLTSAHNLAAPALAANREHVVVIKSMIPNS
ncbi:MAG: enoyl-CoA hydratase/isomerase family protein [Boseongicola sp.]